MRKKHLLKKAMVAFMVTTLLVGTMTGCGNNDNTKSEKNDSDKVKLTVFSTLQAEPEGEIEKQYVDEFMEENPNIEVELVSIPSNELYKKLVALNAADQLPDAFTLFADAMAVYHDMGMMIDHRELMDQEYLDKLNDNVKNEITIDEEIVMFPVYIAPTAMIYRSDWLEEAGMDKIETMDDFKKAAKAFTKDDHWGFSMVGTNNASGVSRFKQFVRAYGVNEIYQDEDGKWTSDLLSDTYTQGLQDFVDLSLVDGVVPDGVVEAGYPEAATYFSQEKTGLMFTGSNAIGMILDSNPELEGKIASAPIPMKERHVSSLNTSGYAISKSCEHPEEMAKLLKFLTEKQRSVDFAKATGRLPVTDEALEDAAFEDQAYRGFIDCMQYAIPETTFPEYGKIMDIMGNSYNTMLSSGMSAEEMVASTEAEVTKILDSVNK